MDSSQIRRLVASRPVSALNLKAPPPTEIGEVLKLSPEDLARFVPLVVASSITSTGIVSLSLREEFRYRPTPDSRDLLLRVTFRGTISPGKLEVEEGLAAIVGMFVKTNIHRIEEATEENVRGVRVVAGLGTEFYPV